MQQALVVTLNGMEKAFEGLGHAPSVSDIVQALGFRADRVALERNGEIVPRTQWAGTGVMSGDCIELVHFVGGGIS